MRKYMTYLGIAFVLFYVLSQPSSAATVARNALDGARTAGDSLAQFVNALS